MSRFVRDWQRFGNFFSPRPVNAVYHYFPHLNWEYFRQTLNAQVMCIALVVFVYALHSVARSSSYCFGSMPVITKYWSSGIKYSDILSELLIYYDLLDKTKVVDKLKNITSVPLVPEIINLDISCLPKSSSPSKKPLEVAFTERLIFTIGVASSERVKIKMVVSLFVRHSFKFVFKGETGCRNIWTILIEWLS